MKKEDLEREKRKIEAEFAFKKAIAFVCVAGATILVLSFLKTLIFF